MTAVQDVKFETRTQRRARERKVWIEQAVAYMIEIDIYAQEEVEQATNLAENLHFHCKDEGGEMMCSPKDAVDEELRYWGG